MKTKIVICENGFPKQILEDDKDIEFAKELCRIYNSKEENKCSCNTYHTFKKIIVSNELIQ